MIAMTRDALHVQTTLAPIYVTWGSRRAALTRDDSGWLQHHPLVKTLPNTYQRLAHISRSRKSPDPFHLRLGYWWNLRKLHISRAPSCYITKSQHQSSCNMKPESNTATICHQSLSLMHKGRQSCCRKTLNWWCGIRLALKFVKNVA